MLSCAALRKTATGWEFVSEEALEDFVAAHLENLLGLTTIERQYSISEQRSELIAVDDDRSLTVLELKNSEDRYIVQQLTRYYHALLESKPFADRINYDRPVRLIAIAPNFHRDNFTDRKYSQLNLQFLECAIVPDGEKLYFRNALSLSKIDEYSYLRHWPVGSRYSASDWQVQTWDLKHYLTEIGKPNNESNPLDFLINLALQKWRERL
jgi:hypothetical protein